MISPMKMFQQITQTSRTNFAFIFMCFAPSGEMQQTLTNVAILINDRRAKQLRAGEN